MKRIINNLLLAIVIIFAAVSCYYDNEEALNPRRTPPCDTTNVTFTGTILPMLAVKCLVCHSIFNSINLGNNIMLETYDQVRLRAYQIDGAINNRDGYFAMPHDSARLSDCLIMQFEIWLKDGTPDN